LLVSQVVASAHIVGFDEYVGYLHSTQYGKPALAIDVVEMFRAPVVDSVVLTVLNNRMLDYRDFEETLGAWRLSESGRKLFLQKFEERLNTEISHPILKTKVTYRRCLEIQMRLLSRWLLGELNRLRGFYTR
jgi:CRISPR-associated protein Cas1